MPSPFGLTLPAGDLLECLDTDADNDDSTQDRERDRQDSSQRRHGIRRDRGEARSQRRGDGDGLRLIDFLLPL